MKKMMMILICTVVTFSVSAYAKKDRKPDQATGPVTGNVGKIMALKQNACKPVKHPKRAVCQLIGKMYSKDVSQKLVVPLKGSDSGVGMESEFAASGSLEITTFPVSAGDRKNELKIDITTETHGNAPNNCQIQQSVNGELNIGYTVIQMGRFVEYKSGDSPKAPLFDIKMACQLY